MTAVASKEQPLGRRVMRALRAIPQYTRTSRHARSLLYHSTPQKILTLLRVESEYRLRRTVVKGRPYILIVDPTNVCNLRCPLCPTGLGEPGRKSALMPWETFTRVIDQLSPWAYEANLYNWGESTLHPHIWDMIRYATSRNLATNLSTNLNDVSNNAVDGIIESGLEYLCLSIDGATQETYSRYRVRGNLDVVLQNVRKLIERKKELGSPTPITEWQFIVFRHNAHEAERARELAAELGVDRFRLIPPGIPFESPNPAELRKKWFVSTSEGGEEEDHRKPLKSPCFYLYRSFTVNPDGGTAPCCVVYGKHNDFGQILQQDFDEIWNNEKYRSARSQFRRNGRITTPTVCDRCDWFEKRTLPSSVEGAEGRIANAPARVT
jgi:radical SAM protein with 4Fe4S-binding SPASM domain